MEIIKEKYNETNPLIIKNYPYGFKKTQIKVFIESVKNKGDRYITQTQNPKTLKWNNPKKSIYNAVMVLISKENGHISYLGLYSSTSKEDYEQFINKVGDYEFNDLQTHQLKLLRSLIKVYSKVEYTCTIRKFKNKFTGEITENIPIFNMNDYDEVNENGEIINREEENTKQKEIQNKINMCVGMEYQNDQGSL